MASLRQANASEIRRSGLACAQPRFCLLLADQRVQMMRIVKGRIAEVENTINQLKDQVTPSAAHQAIINLS